MKAQVVQTDLDINSSSVPVQVTIEFTEGVQKTVDFFGREVWDFIKWCKFMHFPQFGDNMFMLSHRIQTHPQMETEHLPTKMSDLKQTVNKSKPSDVTFCHVTFKCEDHWIITWLIKKKMQENVGHNLILRLNNWYNSSYGIKMLAKTKNLTLTLQSILRSTSDIILELWNVTTIHSFAPNWIIPGCIYFCFSTIVVLHVVCSAQMTPTKTRWRWHKVPEINSAPPTLNPDPHHPVIFAETLLISKQIKMALRLHTMQTHGLIFFYLLLQVRKVWAHLQSADKNS